MLCMEKGPVCYVPSPTLCKVDVHVAYLQSVLNAVGEVLEGAQRYGFIRP